MRKDKAARVCVPGSGCSARSCRPQTVQNKAQHVHAWHTSGLTHSLQNIVPLSVKCMLSNKDAQKRRSPWVALRSPSAAGITWSRTLNQNLEEETGSTHRQWSITYICIEYVRLQLERCKLYSLMPQKIQSVTEIMRHSLTHSVKWNIGSGEDLLYNVSSGQFICWPLEVAGSGGHLTVLQFFQLLTFSKRCLFFSKLYTQIQELHTQNAKCLTSLAKWSTAFKISQTHFKSKHLSYIANTFAIIL